MMDAMNAIINVFNFVLIVGRIYATNVIQLVGLLRIKLNNAYLFVEMERSMDMNNVMMVIKLNRMVVVILVNMDVILLVLIVIKVYV